MTQPHLSPVRPESRAGRAPCGDRRFARARACVPTSGPPGARAEPNRPGEIDRNARDPGRRQDR